MRGQRGDDRYLWMFPLGQFPPSPRRGYANPNQSYSIRRIFPSNSPDLAPESTFLRNGLACLRGNEGYGGFAERIAESFVGACTS